MPDDDPSRRPAQSSAPVPEAAAKIGLELGGVDGQRDQPFEALRLAESTLQRARLVLGEKHPETLLALESFAVALGKSGLAARALPQHELALKLNTEVLGEKHPNTLVAMVNHAYALYALGRYDEARPRFDLALQSGTDVLGAKHPGMVTARKCRLELLRIEGERTRGNEAGILPSAQPLPPSESLWKLKTEALGEKHPDTLDALADYAGDLLSAGRAAEALRHFERVLGLRTEVLGEKHPAIGSSADRCGRALMWLDRPAEALPHFKHALQLILERETRYQILRLFYDPYIEALRALEHIAEALPYCEHTLKLSTQQFGESHPWTMDARRRYTDTLKSLGRHAEALPYLERTVENSARKRGEKEWVDLAALEDYVQVLCKLGHHDEAVPNCKRALEQLVEMDPYVLTPFGQFDPLRKDSGNASYEHASSHGMGRAAELVANNTVGVRTYASVLFRLGRFDEALADYEQAWKFSVWGLGQKHPDTVVALNNYAYLLFRLGRIGEALPHYGSTFGVGARPLSGEDIERFPLDSLGPLAGELRTALLRAGKDAAALAQAEERACASGKELFSVPRLEELFGDGGLSGRENWLKLAYYVHQPEIMTLADFVKWVKGLYIV